MIANRFIRLIRGVRPICALLLFISCNEPTLDSAWRPLDDSSGATAKYSSYILNGEDVVVALQNDNHNLYLRIKAANTASQIKMTSGLTVWLDASGAKKKSFGIQYPLARAENMLPRGKSKGRGERPESGEFGELGGFGKPGGIREFGSGNRDSIMIFGPGKDDKRIISIHNQFGISVTISHDVGPMVYDLTIPLDSSETAPYAIGAKRGALISLGIETASVKPRMKRMNDGEHRKPGGGDDSFGGSSGGTKTPGGFGDGGDWGGDGNWGNGGGTGGPGGGVGGVPGGGGRGHGGGEGRGMPEGSQGINASPLKFWAKIRLATDKQAAQ